MSSLGEVKSSWNRFAESDAMGAVMTGEEWDEDAFYRTGLSDIDSLMEEAQDVYPDLQLGEALDFGCGLGRLSFGLARRFKRVTGIDISNEMIERAASNSRAPENVTFVLNEDDHLKRLDSNAYDFVLSLIVLQHMPRKFARSYIAEFLRIARPGGLAVFQLPTRKRRRKKAKLRLWDGKPLDWDKPSIPKLCYRAAWRGLRWIPRWIVHSIHQSETWCWLYYAWQQRKGNAVMQMNTMSIASIKRLVQKNGGTVLDVREDARAGDEYESHTFFVRKND